VASGVAQALTLRQGKVLTGRSFPIPLDTLTVVSERARSTHMFFKTKEQRERERESKRFYLLPGMGGRAYRRKQDLILKVSIAVGLLVSGVFTLIMWLIYRTPK
jgi:hypothetical protein